MLRMREVEVRVQVEAVVVAVAAAAVVNATVPTSQAPLLLCVLAERRPQERPRLDVHTAPTTTQVAHCRPLQALRSAGTACAAHMARRVTPRAAAVTAASAARAPRTRGPP